MDHPPRRRPRPSGHRLGVRLEHAQSPDRRRAPAAAVVGESAVHHVHRRARAARPERRHHGTLGGASGRARRGQDIGHVLRRRTRPWRARPALAAAAPALSRARHSLRHRLRYWLHRTGEHAGEVVSRAARHGHGLRHHGIRRGRLSGRLRECVSDRADGRGARAVRTERGVLRAHVGRGAAASPRPRIAAGGHHTGGHRTHPQ